MYSKVLRNAMACSLLLLPFFLHAQNVGIGTQIPDAKLHVAGDLKVDSALQLGRIELVDSTGDVRMILDANTGSLQMLDNDSLFYYTAVNSDKQDTTFYNNGKVMVVRYSSGGSQFVDKLVKKGNEFVREKRFVFNRGPDGRRIEECTIHYDTAVANCPTTIRKITAVPSTKEFCGQSIFLLFLKAAKFGISTPDFKETRNFTYYYSCSPDSGAQEKKVVVEGTDYRATIQKLDDGGFKIDIKHPDHTASFIANDSLSIFSGTIVEGSKKITKDVFFNGDTITTRVEVAPNKIREERRYFPGFVGSELIYVVEYCLDSGIVNTKLPDGTTFSLNFCEIIKGKADHVSKKEKISVEEYEEKFEKDDDFVAATYKPAEKKVSYKNVDTLFFSGLDSAFNSIFKFFSFGPVASWGEGTKNAGVRKSIQPQTFSFIQEFFIPGSTQELWEIINSLDKKYSRGVGQQIYEMRFNPGADCIERTFRDSMTGRSFSRKVYYNDPADDYEVESGPNGAGENSLTREIWGDDAMPRYTKQLIDKATGEALEQGLLFDVNSMFLRRDSTEKSTELDPGGQSILERYLFGQSSWNQRILPGNGIEETDIGGILLQRRIFDENFGALLIETEDDLNNKVSMVSIPQAQLIEFQGSSGNVQFDVLGNANIAGNLSKGGGSFKIDHPLDPYNKYLYHSFVESPDMMNIYNGNITTDEHGFATVEMPEYFNALNRDFRYQLTVIGSFAQAIVKEEMSGNQFVIQTNEPNIKVSWLVTGVRQDRYAEHNRIQVEVDKEPEKKGTLLYDEHVQN